MTPLGEERKALTRGMAIAMLPPTPRIHTFRSTGACLVGADWDRADVIEALGRFSPELSGAMASGMKHGIVIEDEHGYLFIETVDATLRGEEER